MSTTGDEHDGIRILSLGMSLLLGSQISAIHLQPRADSGGPGTYSQLLILKEYMSRLAHDMRVSEDEVYPADHFDLMGGVGFGGCVCCIRSPPVFLYSCRLAVVALGLLRMNVNQAIDAVVAVASAVFPEDSHEAIERSERSRNLKAVVEGMLQARKIPVDTKMYDPIHRSKCKVLVHSNHPRLPS